GEGARTLWIRSMTHDALSTPLQVSREGALAQGLILLDDEPVPAGEARVSPASPGFAYAACVFEGICAYWDEQQRVPLLFRLDEHLQRLQRSMQAVRFADPPELDLLRKRVMRAISVSNVRADAHLRLMAYVDGATRIAETGPVRTAI